MSDVPRIANAVANLITAGLPGGSVLVTVGRMAKSRIQERKYHAMIRDIAKTIPETEKGMTRDPEIWKALLVHEFAKEMKAMGTPLTHPGKVVLSLDKMEAITIRPSTKKLRKKEAIAFVEFLYAFAVDTGARFSDPSLSYYDEYMQMKAAA